MEQWEMLKSAVNINKVPINHVSAEAAFKGRQYILAAN